MIRTDLIAPIAELLERQAARFPNKVGYRDDARSITWAGLEEATRNLATQLRANGFAPGDTAGIWMPNGVDWVIACLSIVRAGGTAVPIPWDSSQSEALYRLDDAECTFAFADGERVAALERIAAQSGVAPRLVVRGAARPEGALDFAALLAAPAAGVALAPDDIEGCSYIVYTSGTTGRPKGVRLSSRALLWATAACWTPILGYEAEDVVLSPLPLFHSYALTIAVLSPLATGATVQVMERFSTKRALELLRTGDFTLMPGVPTMFHYLMLADEGGENPFAGLRMCISAGAIMPANLNAAFEQRYGTMLVDSYGITEMSTMVTMNWPSEHRMPGSCGLPIPGLALRVVDPVSGLDVPFGEEGELICRGPNLMLGYHRKPEETAAAIRAGWYHTGDLARFDANGFVTITGRLKEIIIRGGQNIAPAEVEETVASMDDVMDCAVVGVPHDTLGEVPCAFIVPRAGRDVDEEAVRRFCGARLSAYKVPATIRIVEEIPRTGSGKIQRFRLRALVENAHERA